MNCSRRAKGEWQNRRRRRSRRGPDGAGEHLQRLIEAGISIAFSPAMHSPFTTWSGRYSGRPGRESGTALAGAGHENHLRAINAIRACGGIAAAVQKNL